MPEVIECRAETAKKQPCYAATDGYIHAKTKASMDIAQSEWAVLSRGESPLNLGSCQTAAVKQH